MMMVSGAVALYLDPRSGEGSVVRYYVAVGRGREFWESTVNRGTNRGHRFTEAFTTDGLSSFRHTNNGMHQ